MVYCGKPSKGCGHCRTRKIRCDQARPACSQCIRAKRDCPGYRDQLSLMFRDETKSVRRKVANSNETSISKSNRSTGQSVRTASSNRNSNGSSTKISTPDLSPSGVQDVCPKSDPPMALIQRLWQLPLEIHPSSEPSPEEAICFYLQTNAIPGSFWMSEFVTNFLMQPGGTTSKKAMQASITAVASAMLSRTRNVESLRHVARREYVSALTLLNTSLADPEEAKTNQALGAVVLLAIYEVGFLPSTPTFLSPQASKEFST